MSHGFTLYDRIYDLQPPAIYWLYWVLLALGGGQNHFLIEVAVSLFVVGAAVLTSAVASRFLALRPAVLAGGMVGFALAIPALAGAQLNVELAGLPFFLGALALAFSERRVAVLAAGALLGVALVFRPSYVLDGAALLVPLLAGRRPAVRLLLAAAGGALALAAVTGGLWLQGSLPAYVSLV